VALDKEFKQQLVDRFEAWELCDFLQIKTEDFIDAFEENIEEAIEDVQDFAGLKLDEEEKEIEY
jgi:hypothetical protein